MCVFIRGSEVSAGMTRYEACYNAAKSFIQQKYKVHKVPEILTVPFVTISYYYDRAVESKLIGKLIHGKM